MQDARIIVVGASGDIGRAIAVTLLEAGSEVLVLGRRLDSLARIQSPLSRHKPICLSVDLTDAAAVERLATDLAAARRLDGLILSSGTYDRSKRPEGLRQQLEANLIGPYALLRAVLPLLVESKGHVVFINSSQALRASADVEQYAATKHALKAIADSLRDEVNESGVRVTSLYLGRTAGERQREIFAMEGRRYCPERLVQPADVGRMVHQVMQLSRTVEVTDVMMRPMLKPDRPIGERRQDLPAVANPQKCSK